MIAVVGCGTVGGGTALLFSRDSEQIKKKTGICPGLKYVVDLNFDHAEKIGIPQDTYEKDLDKVLNDPEVTIVVELVGGLTFAKDVVAKSLKAKKNVVTANKALLATYGKELFSLARENGVTIGFEASCGGGIPIINALTDGLCINKVDALYGIVNGTCNYILTEMIDKGMSYDTALKAAQELGLAEADPTLDVNGMDSAHKITIMSSLAFGKSTSLENVTATGIENLDLYDVKLGKEMGYVIKLLAVAEEINGAVNLRVEPTFIPAKHPLANISDSFNAVSVYGHAVGHTLYYGRGAGALPTASAVAADIISVASGKQKTLFDTYKYWVDITPEPEYIDKKDISSDFYMRINVTNGKAPHEVSAVLAENNAKVQFMELKEAEGNSQPLVVLVKDALFGDMDKAVKALTTASSVEGAVQCIPVLKDKKEFTA